jgi:hypothetical protein
MNQTLLDPKLKTKANDIQIDVKISMWCNYDPINQSIKFELISN